MPTTLPKIRTNRGNIGNEVLIHLPDFSSFEKTYLSQSSDVGATTLNVLSGINFTANQYIVVGKGGTEKAEILLPSVIGNTSFTVPATKFAHPQGTEIRFIPFNQIEISSATAISGSYSVDSTIAIRIDGLETYYQDTNASTRAYKVRFKNSQDATYSDYSDEVLGSGYADNTVWSVKQRALNQLGEKIDIVITDSFLNEVLWEGRREFDNERKRWSFRTSFNTDIGDISEGAYSVSSPSTLRNPDSPQNILGLRLGADGINIAYIPKREWDDWYRNKPHTTVATQPAIGATSLVLTDANDFEDSGTVKVAGDDITYTGKSTDTLTGIPASGDGSITVQHAVGINVWQNADYGTPQFYTIFEDTIYFNTPFENSIDGQNIFMDYYRTLPPYNSDADVLDELDFDMFVSWLKWKIKERKAKGELRSETDDDWKEWQKRKLKMMRRETLNQLIKFIPIINIDEE